MKVFLLTYDATRFIANPRSVEAFIANHKSVMAWSSPFNGCFFIKTEADLREFSSSLSLFFSNRRYIVAHISGSGNKTNGRAVREIWDFLKESE